VCVCLCVCVCVCAVAYTHTPAYADTCSISPPLALFFSSLPLSLTHAHSFALFSSRSLSRSLSHTRTHTQTHMRTHVHTLTLTHTHVHTQVLLQLCKEAYPEMVTQRQLGGGVGCIPLSTVNALKKLLSQWNPPSSTHTHTHTHVRTCAHTHT